MKIQVEQNQYDIAELIYIAKVRIYEVDLLPSFYSEALYKTDDNSYIVMTYEFEYGANNEEKVDDINNNFATFKLEPNPELWLLNNGQERLAGFMFPGLRKKVEHSLYTSNLQRGAEKGETFYRTGEAKGEASGGN